MISGHNFDKYHLWYIEFKRVVWGCLRGLFWDISSRAKGFY